MKFFVFACALLVSMMSFGQAQVCYSGVTYLNKNESRLGKDATKRGYYVGPHALGDTITMLLNRFENDYVYYEEGDGAYRVEEKKIVKPSLYRAIKKIEKHYSKSLKKNSVDESYAYSRLKLIIRKGITLMNYDTREFEEQLRKIKSIERTEEFILKVKVK